MKLGITLAFSQTTPVPFIIGAAERVEAAGFHSLWVPEHVLFFPDYASRYPYSDDGRLAGDPQGLLDPFSALTFIAARTQTIRLGTGICSAAPAGVHRKDGRGPRLPLRRARGLRHRHRLVGRRVRCAWRAVQ
jgi:hypothetical protein